MLIWSFQQSGRIDVIIPILQIRKLRITDLRNVAWVIQLRSQGQNLNLNLPIFRGLTFNHLKYCLFPSAYETNKTEQNT